MNVRDIELSYYDADGKMKVLYGKSVPILGTWTQVVFSSEVDPTNATLFRVSINGVDVVAFSVTRSESSDNRVFIGGSGGQKYVVTGCLSSILFYTSVVSPVVDSQIRAILPRDVTQIRSFFGGENQLQTVMAASSGSLALVTMSHVRLLTQSEHPLEMEVKQEPIDVFQPVYSSPSNSRQDSYTIEEVHRSTKHAVEKDSIETVEDLELYLQSTPYSNLIEGNYASVVPSHLQQQWKQLNDERAARVRESMKHFWKAYQRVAFGADELQPLSEKGRNNWGNISLTLIDSLDTLWLMDMRDEFKEAVDYLEQVQFDSDTSVSVFEFSIRVLGGLLSAYYLSQDPRLLEKAVEAGNVVMGAFDSEHALPHVLVLFLDHLDTYQSTDPKGIKSIWPNYVS